MLVPQEAAVDVDDVVVASVHVDDAANIVTDKRVRKLEKKRKLEVYGLKRLKKAETAQRIESSTDTVMDDQEDASKQKGIIELIDADKDVILEEVDAKKDAKVAEDNADV
nr:hypothetical protein [Tanacetum cinerariifolium]